MTNLRPAPIYLLPGLGADRENFGPSFHADNRIKLLEWPKTEKLTTMQSIAEHLVELHRIPEGAIVGGCSLGGMVACHIGLIVGAPRIILIGSAMRRKEINPILVKLLAIASTAIFRMLQILVALSPLRWWLPTRMLMRVDAAFMAAACRAIDRWQGCPDQVSERVVRIHGTRDHVIPVPDHIDVRMSGAGHMLARYQHVQVHRALHHHIGS